MAYLMICKADMQNPAIRWRSERWMICVNAAESCDEDLRWFLLKEQVGAGSTGSSVRHTKLHTATGFQIRNNGSRCAVLAAAIAGQENASL